MKYYIWNNVDGLITDIIEENLECIHDTTNNYISKSLNIEISKESKIQFVYNLQVVQCLS